MKKIIPALAFFLLQFSVSGQSIDSALMKYGTSYTQEKAYLHYDKSTYYPGETVWFKAYLMEGIYPSEGSKTFYVDWVSDEGKVLYHTVSPLINGATNGQFEIPSEYSGSFIHVRAYTRWMLNFDTAFLYSRDLPILTAGKDVKLPKPPAPVPSIHFFPEGGEAVAGVMNKIAFKAEDQWGRPVKVRGVVLDNKNAVVDSIVSVHDGMGIFMITPAASATYTARWVDEKGKPYTTQLPVVKTSGISMLVTLSENRRVVTLSSSAALSPQLKMLHMVGTANQQMAFKVDIPMTEGNTVRRAVPIDKLPSGILTITIFDNDWKPVAERITFINNNDFSFQPQMEVKYWGLGKRKRNELEVRIPENVDAANLSISITDAAIEKDTTDQIISHLLLSSEIRGKVFNPAYYFINNSDSVQMHLDLVMLTNGWRRFKWDDLVKGKMPEIRYPKDTGYLSLSGQLFGVQRSQLSGKESIALIVKENDTTSKLLIMPVNKNGSFGDPGIIFFDTLQVFYSLKNKMLANAEARFMTDRLPAPNYQAFIRNLGAYRPFYDTSGVYHHSLLASKSAEIDAIRRGTVMETVTVRAKQKSPLQEMDEKYANGLFKGMDGYQFNLLEDQSAMGQLNIFNYLQGKVAGLQISNGGGETSLNWRGGSPLLYLNEVQSDVSMLNSIPVSDIAYVKVFRPPFLGGFGGSSGAIAIYTRRGNDSPVKSTGLSNNKVSGYTPVREFYSPNYDRFDARNDALDIRTTLYWNPGIQTTPKNRIVKLTFYNNDTAKSFRVVIEGMSSNGLLTHYEEIME